MPRSRSFGDRAAAALLATALLIGACASPRHTEDGGTVARRLAHISAKRKIAVTPCVPSSFARMSSGWRVSERARA